VTTPADGGRQVGRLLSSAVEQPHRRTEPGRTAMIGRRFLVAALAGDRDRA